MLVNVPMIEPRPPMTEIEKTSIDIAGWNVPAFVP